MTHRTVGSVSVSVESGHDCLADSRYFSRTNSIKYSLVRRVGPFFLVREGFFRPAEWCGPLASAGACGPV